MEYMRPPITLCVVGHNICNTCKPKIYDCPTCRQPFSDIRNVALETLARDVKYPCTYRKYGCKEILSHDMIVEHEEKCWYSPQICPVAKLASGSCSCTGSYDDIKGHLKEKHSADCYEYAETDLGRWLEKFSTTKRYWRFVFAYNEVFFRLFEAKDEVFYAVLQYIGPPENAAKYKYKVKFYNQENTEGVTIMLTTRSLAEHVDDIFRSGNCGKLHYDVVRRLRDKECNLHFKLKILRVRE
jgi:hypothetical protein